MAGALKGRVGPALALALTLGLAACGAAGTGRPIADPFSGGGGSSREGSRQLQVEVENRNFNQATIVARGPAMQRRLGRVSGNDSGRFSVQWAMSDLLYFEIDLLGGGQCTTRMVQVEPGQSIRLVIDSVSRMRADGISRMCDVERGRSGGP